MICPDCGFSNRVGVQICENCEADLYDSLLEMVATKQLSKADTREITGLDEHASPTSNPIVIYISHDKNPLAIERMPNLVMGRIDPNDSHQQTVDVDLEAYGAQELGVSRQHARLLASKRNPILVDLGSYNGTYINGQKLVPSHDYEVNSGDEIRMGRLVMRFYFK